VERLPDIGGAFPQECFTCPARTYIDEEYFCDPSKFDDSSVTLDVARYRPDGCRSNGKEANHQISPEILLRKILGR